MPKETWGDLEGTFGTKALTMSPQERDYAARTVMAEAGGDKLNQAAVMHVIRNRALHGGFGEGVEGVIKKPYAFEPWLHAGSGKGNDPLAYSAEDPNYQQALRIVDAVAAGQIPDPTKGATHFYSPQAQKQLASLDNRALVPGWAKPEARTATIGGHEFYNLASNTPVGKKVINVTRGVPADYDWLGESYKEHLDQKSGVTTPAPEFMEQAEKERRPMPPPLPVVRQQPPEDWGAGQSLTTGMTLGAWPYIKAGVQTLDDYTQGKVKEPSLSTLVTGEPTGVSGRYKQNLENIEKERAAYQTYAPIGHMLAEQGGALVGTALPMSLAAKGIAAGGRLVGEALPMAKPALQAAGRFFSGETGANAPGLVAGLQRGASYAGQGAAQGAGQALFTQGLQPEGSDFKTQLAYGAGGGALMSSFVNPLFSSLAAPLAAEIAPNVRSLAQAVNQKFDLNLRPTQIARDAEINALDRRVIPQHVADEQVVKFNEELAKQLGMQGKELTKANVEFEMRKVGKELSDIAATTSMKPRRQFFQDLGDVRADLYATTLDGNPLRAKVDSILMKIYNESVTGVMDGNKFRAFVKKDGLLDKELLNSGDPSARMLGYKLKDKMFEMFEVSDPRRASAYNQARLMYRKLVAAEPLANTSGVVDPTALLKRVQKQRLTGDMSELGEAGKFMPKTTSTGSARLPPKPSTMDQIREYSRSALPAIPSAIAYYMNMPTGAVTAASALLGGGQYLGAQARNWAMASPAVGRAVLSGKLPNVITPAENVLARGVSDVATQVGAGSEKRRRK